jgi:hypothetical protein
MTPPRKTESLGTDDLILRLAAEAVGRPAPSGLWLERRLGLASVLAVCIGAGLAVLLFGSGPSLASTVPTAPFWHKVACSLAIAAGGFLLARSLARPEGSVRPLAALLPGAVLLALGAVMDDSGYPVMGRSGQSVPICLGAIVLLSLPALGLILGVVRSGAPTRPTFAGTATGILAGGLGAAAYAVACKNDGGLFVAVWYSAAILIVAGLGALAGRRVLAW